MKQDSKDYVGLNLSNANFNKLQRLYYLLGIKNEEGGWKIELGSIPQGNFWLKSRTLNCYILVVLEF